MNKHESPLKFAVTISKEYRRMNSPRLHLDDLIAGCPLPIKSVGQFEDVFVPVSQGEVEHLSANGIQTISYEGKVCKAALRVELLIEGEYPLEDVENAFNNEQDHIKIFVDFLYEKVSF